jgi:hypothetical protein
MTLMMVVLEVGEVEPRPGGDRQSLYQLALHA